MPTTKLINCFFRFEIGRCHLNSRIMANMPRCKFDCEWEESNLWMQKNLSIKKKTFDKQLVNDVFVKVLHIGCLNFTVDCLIQYKLDADNYPRIEINLNNDFIKVTF